MRFQVCIKIEHGYAGKANMTFDSEWANKTAEEIRRRRQKKDTEKQAFVTGEELKKAHGPELWKQLKTEVLARKDLLLHELGEQDAITYSSKAADEFVLTGKSGGTVRANFDSSRLIIELVLISTGITYAVAVVNRNVVLTSRQKDVVTPAEISRECLDALVDFV